MWCSRIKQANIITVLCTALFLFSACETKKELNTVESIHENMVAIPGGTFEMGDAEDDTGDNEYSDKCPQHTVSVPPFAMSAYEVTQGQWKAVMGTNPSYFSECGDSCPVENVSWDDVQDFIETLNTQTGMHYRLPTEAEWEYAARAGTHTKWYCGGEESCLDDTAWYEQNSGYRTHPVGRKAPNAFGLYDMTGNVLEWVQDCYHQSYKGAPSDGSAWETGCCDSEYDSSRMFRGGSCYCSPKSCMISFRRYYYPSYEYSSLGFRLVLPQNSKKDP